MLKLSHGLTYEKYTTFTHYINTSAFFDIFLFQQPQIYLSLRRVGELLLKTYPKRSFQENLDNREKVDVERFSNESNFCVCKYLYHKGLSKIFCKNMHKVLLLIRRLCNDLVSKQLEEGPFSYCINCNPL